MKNLLSAFLFCGLVFSSLSCAPDDQQPAGSTGDGSTTAQAATDPNPTSVQPDDSSSLADVQALQGTWKTVSMITEGKGMDPAQQAALEEVTVTFEGNRWIKKNKDKVMMDWTFAVDATTTPRRMTINRADDGEPEKLSLLIYKIDGEKLTTLSGSRKYPTEFTEQTVKGCYLTEYIRITE